MTCQGHHCHQGRQPCPTPYTCRTACATLKTGNSDGSNPHRSTGQDQRSRTDDFGLMFIGAVCLFGVVVILAMLAGYLSVKLA